MPVFPLVKSYCSFLNVIFWNSGFLEAKRGEKETSLPANTTFEDAMIFVTKCSVISHARVILYIIYVLYIIYNIT